MEARVKKLVNAPKMLPKGRKLEDKWTGEVTAETLAQDRTSRAEDIEKILEEEDGVSVTDNECFDTDNLLFASECPSEADQNDAEI